MGTLPHSGASASWSGCWLHDGYCMVSYSALSSHTALPNDSEHEISRVSTHSRFYKYSKYFVVRIHFIESGIKTASTEAHSPEDAIRKLPCLWLLCVVFCA